MRAPGEFRDSVELLRDTWAWCRAVLGDDMIDTLRTAELGGLAAQGRREQSEAMNLAQDTHERFRRRYGSDTPEAQPGHLGFRTNLATTLHESGLEKEAEEMQAAILGDFGRILDAGHPHAAQLRNWQRINCELELQQS